MQCNCGGLMTARDVIRDNLINGKYEYCNSCGRIEWLFMTQTLKEELGWRSSYSLKCNELYGDDVPDYVTGYERYICSK